jgi:alkylhydroperoxidase family enzyme
LKVGNHSHLSEKERAALLYSEELTRAPGKIQEADVEGLKKHFSDAEILDLHLLVGVANLTNRFTGPLGLELEFPAEKI